MVGKVSEVHAGDVGDPTLRWMQVWAWMWESWGFLGADAAREGRDTETEWHWVGLRHLSLLCFYCILASCWLLEKRWTRDFETGELFSPRA